MKQGMTLVELAQEVERQAQAKMDFVASTDSLDMIPEWKPDTMSSEDDTKDPAKWGPPKLVVNADDSPLRGQRFDINNNAHAQIAERVGIPKKYYDRMLVDAPHLLSENVNHWLHFTPERRMVRTLDGRARAFLSDRYQRRDNFELMKFMLPVLTRPDQTGIVPWTFHSQSLTEDNLYLKLVHTNAMSITTIRGVDDKVHAGIVISNSEVGKRALRIDPLLWWEWCRNGAVATRYSQRRVHLGGKQGGDDAVALMLSDETKRLEDEAFFAKARDVVAYFANPDTFAKIIGEINVTTDRQITGKVERGVEVLGNILTLTSDETEGVLRNLITNTERYGLTQYGLLNAVTAMAQNVDDYDRATQIEEAADRVIDLSPSQWREIAEAA